jgi:predicted porin
MHIEESNMNRIYLLGVAISMVMFGVTANADVKDPLPDSLSLGGVTLYGTVDIGYAYQNHGVPLSSTYVGGLEYQAFTTTRNFAGSVSTVAESGLEQSKIGVRVTESIATDWNLVARLETGFNPLSGQLTDACASLATNSVNKQGNQTANADSSRCGQAFNSMAWGGLSNTQFGQLTIGRHNSLQLDALAVYDPQTLSYAFSFLGYSGFNGGAGSTQAARWNNSVRYGFQNGPVHLAVMYSNGGQDIGILGHAYAAQLGGNVQNLSVDAVYQNVTGAVNLRSSFDNNGINPLTTPAGPGLPPPGLAAYTSDDTSWNLMGKYTVELGDAKQKDKLTLYAGYSHIEKSHYTYTVGSAQGGYPIDVGININNSAVYNMEWVGARYAFSSGLNLVGAYYHISQNSWTIGLGTTGTQGVGCSAAGLLCAGDFNEASFVVDYIFNKHYDVYVGLNWSEVTDGLANGFPGTTVGTSGSQSQTTFMIGGRVKF